MRYIQLSPKFGSEIIGLQLDKLDTRARQQLALYVAQRGIVVSTSPFAVSYPKTESE